MSVPANGSAIVRATTADGHILPVIDVMHPAFRVADDATAVDAMRAAYRRVKHLQHITPKPLSRGVMWLAARHSSFARALLKPDAAYLDGLHTYVLKLGGRNLPPPFNGIFNRRVADSPVAMSMRVRLQQLARMMAEGLTEMLRARPGAPLHFVNIGGGVGIDSINALIVLRRAAPELLAGRRATIHVLDADAAAPRFGASALAALLCPGGPLHGVDAMLKHQPYDWHDRRPLQELIRGLAAGTWGRGEGGGSGLAAGAVKNGGDGILAGAVRGRERGAIVAVSSEGGVFEYGDDDTVTGNLRALNAGNRGWISGGIGDAAGCDAAGCDAAGCDAGSVGAGCDAAGCDAGSVGAGGDATDCHADSAGAAAGGGAAGTNCDRVAMLVAGSVTRADPLARHAIGNTRFGLVPRGIEGLEPLAVSSGFAVARTEASLLSDQFVLVPR